MSPNPHNRWLNRYATFVAFATFLLIIAGALVTSNDAGLSVPDWPTSFGSFRMPRMVGGVKFEHGHRMIAGTVGLLTIVLALWLWRSEPRRWVRRLGGLAVAVILAQALLGGITVLLYLPVAVSVSHAALAQVFFCLTVGLAVISRPDFEWPGEVTRDSGTPSLRQLAAGTTGAIFFQTVLGAAFRHNGFGIVPHVLVAGGIVLGVLWLMFRVLTEFRSQPRLVRAAFSLGGLVLFQTVLGIASYMLKLSARNAPQPLPSVVAIATMHVALGALVLAASFLVTLEAWRNLRAEGRGVDALRSTEKALSL